MEPIVAQLLFQEAEIHLDEAYSQFNQTVTKSEASLEEALKLLLAWGQTKWAIHRAP